MFAKWTLNQIHNCQMRLEEQAILEAISRQYKAKMEMQCAITFAITGRFYQKADKQTIV